MLGIASVSSVLFLFCSVSIAQQPYISLLDANTTTLNSVQQERLDRVTAQPEVVATHFIQLAELSQAQSDGKLDLELPGADCTPEFQAIHVESDDSGDFFWHGQLVGGGSDSCVCHDGQVNILQTDGETIATIKVDEHRYEIQPLGDGLHLLVENDYDGLDLYCATPNDSVGVKGATLSSRTETNCPTRVLALFTPGGAAAVPAIMNTIQLSIREFEQALRNSDVSSEDVRVEFVGADPFPFVETGNVVTGLAALIANQNLINARNAAAADIVLVFTAAAYGGVLGNAGTLNLVGGSAVALLDATGALTEFTAAHEIAHLYACRHEVEADNTGPFEHAHDFKTGCWPARTKRNTIMWSSTTEETVQHFSNPDVTYRVKGHRDKPTGVRDSEDNALQLTMNGCTVAAFMPDPAVLPPAVFITGGGFACPCQGANLDAFTSGGATGTYTYAWQTSVDGFNWSSIKGTDNEFYALGSCTIGDVRYVRVTATDPAGISAQAYTSLETAMTWPGQTGSGCAEPRVSSIPASAPVLLQVRPNPVATWLDVATPGHDLAPSDIQIADAVGRQYDLLVAQAGTETVRIRVADLADGDYFVLHRGRLTQHFVRCSR